MPVSYGAGTIKEHKAVRTALGLFDVSHMGEAYLRGPRAREIVAKLTTNAVESAPVGKAVYTLLCTPSGGIVDDCIFYKRADDDFMSSSTRATSTRIWRGFANMRRPRAMSST
jgi:aminomethyltransferase